MIADHFDAVDGCAGPGGWTEGLRSIGLRDIGIELDESACNTRYANGHATWHADMTSIATATIRRLFRGVRGFIASPPCPKFSDAGDGEGRQFIGPLCEAIHRGDWGARPSDDPMIWMALEVGRWVEAIEPEWIALEQVPAVLPLWEAYATWLRGRGYSVWCGVLCAADYGVPQTRRRAVLMASNTRTAQPPAPTHCDGGAVSLFGELKPWVSLAEGLGWVGENVDQPARTLCGDRSPRWMYPDGDGSRGRMVVLDRRQQNADGSPVPPVPPERPSPTLTAQAGKGQWVWRRPATTVCGDPRIGPPGHKDRAGGEPQFGEGSLTLTLTEALLIQSFRPDMNVTGTKTKQFEQIGNAVPPLLAAHIVAALTERR